MNAVDLKGITVRVKPHFWSPSLTILDNLSLSVTKGSVLGVIGPNGAGKTTTLKVLLGLLRPQAGSVQVLGGAITSPEIRRRLGYMPERADFPPYLTAEELVVHHGRLAGLCAGDLEKRVTQVLDLVGLNHAKKRPMGTYSKGMQQRAGLAQSIVHDPELVVLDEPMSGLDPMGRHDVREIIQHLKNEGTTVLLATHILSDVEEICDHVALIVGGRVRRRGALETLTSPQDRTYSIAASGCSPDLLRDLAPLVSRAREQMTQHVFEVEGHGGAQRVVQCILAAGGTLERMEGRTDLESLFLAEVTPKAPESRL